jgi:hypothetical protein
MTGSTPGFFCEKHNANPKEAQLLKSDVMDLGQLLIDFTFVGRAPSEDAPVNVLAALSKENANNRDKNVPCKRF